MYTFYDPKVSSSWLSNKNPLSISHGYLDHKYIELNRSDVTLVKNDIDTTLSITYSATKSWQIYCGDSIPIRPFNRSFDILYVSIAA